MRVSAVLRRLRVFMHLRRGASRIYEMLCFIHVRRRVVLDRINYVEFFTYDRCVARENEKKRGFQNQRGEADSRDCFGVCLWTYGAKNLPVSYEI